MASSVIHRGQVTTFDARVGLGRIIDDAGRELDFHATAVADGGRNIDVGAIVVFRRVAGRQGRWEADQISPIG